MRAFRRRHASGHARVLVSAHRCGCQRRREVENTLAGVQQAVASPVDAVEFDIQRTADGVFLLHHDDAVPVAGVRRPVAVLTAAEVDAAVGRRTRYVEALTALAAGGQFAHLDYKFTSPEASYANPADTFEVAATRMALAALGVGRVVVTTAEDRSVRTVRDWAIGEGMPDLLVGLSIGRQHLTGMTSWQRLAWRWNEAFPGRRIRATGTNLVVSQRHLARYRLIRLAARHRLPVLVWTVDSGRELARLLADPRVWMVTSNFPERAWRLRDETPPTPTPAAVGRGGGVVASGLAA